MKTIIPLAFASLPLTSYKPAEAVTTVTDTAKPSTLDTGEKLGETGKPYEFVHDGQ